MNRMVCVGVLRQLLVALAFLTLAACSSPEQKAASHVERGTALLKQKDYAKAAIEFKSALQIKQDLVTAWRGLAEVEEHSQNVENLIAIYRKIVEFAPKDVEARVRSARLLLMANGLDEAMETINGTLAIDAQNMPARALKAAVLLKLKDVGGAVSEAKAVLAADPDNVEAVIVLAAERFLQQDNAGALAWLDKSEAAKSSFGIDLFRIRILERAGNLNDIEPILTKLIDAYPTEKLFKRQLARLYIEQKKPEEAEKQLRAISAADPADSQAGLDVVRYLQATKGSAAARQELLARIAAGQNAFNYQLALAEFYLAEGATRDGEQVLEKLANGSGKPDEVALAKARLADLYLTTKRITQAEGLVTAILQKDARNAGGLKLRARMQMDQGKTDAAVADLRQALNDHPRAADLMTLLAVAYERSGMIDLADKQYADAVRASNSDPASGITYAGFLRRRGNLARSEDVLMQLLGRWPASRPVLTELAEVRLARQNWIGAQEAADALRRAGSDTGFADQVLGAALQGQKRYEESIEILQTAQAAAPGAAQPLTALVGALVRAQKTDRAVAFLQSVIEKDRTNAEALVLLGSVQLVKQTPAEAEKSFRMAIENAPKSALGYRALADLQRTRGKSDDALLTVQAGLAALPEDGTLLLQQAALLEAKGDYEAAITVYEGMLKREAGSMIVANNLASLLTEHRTDRPSHERAYALAASLRKSQVPHFKDTLGWVHYQRGEHREALVLLQEAAAALPNVAQIRYHLGMNYVALGEPAKAGEQFRKALELPPGEPGLPEKIKVAMRQVGN